MFRRIAHLVARGIRVLVMTAVDNKDHVTGASLKGESTHYYTDMVSVCCLIAALPVTPYHAVLSLCVRHMQQWHCH